MRIIGLDLGTKTLGVAVSDNTMVIATGLEGKKKDKDNGFFGAIGDDGDLEIPGFLAKPSFD